MNYLTIRIIFKLKINCNLKNKIDSNIWLIKKVKDIKKQNYRMLKGKLKRGKIDDCYIIIDDSET